MKFIQKVKDWFEEIRINRSIARYRADSIVHLSQRDWDYLQEIMENPPKPSPELIEAFRQFNEKYKEIP